MIILFKYCADVENCDSFRDFGYIYIYIYMKLRKLLKRTHNGKFCIPIQLKN